MKTSLIRTSRFAAPFLACLLAGTAWDQSRGDLLRIGIGPTKVGKSLAADMQRRGKTIEMGRVTEALDGQYTSAFTKTHKFEVIARTDLQTILDEEQGLPAGSVVDPATAAQKGKIKGLQYMVVISVDGFLDERTELDAAAAGLKSIKGRRVQLSCVANIFDCSTGAALESPNFQSEVRDTTDVRNSESDNQGERLDELMVKIARQTAEKAALRVADVLFPAKVMLVDGTTLTINRGEDLGLKVDDVWDLYGPAKEVADPDTGKLTKIKGKKIGSVKITTVDAETSQGELVGAAGVEVPVGCVLTRPLASSARR